MINSDKIIAEEYKWVIDNEPTFNINGNILTGKVGRAPNGESIIISIAIPEYYPVLKPEVKVLTAISHPNLDNNNMLSLQLLDDWEPVYRVKDIVASTRRLFIKSKRSIKSSGQSVQVHQSNFEEEIRLMQRKISDINKKITEVKNQKLQDEGRADPTAIELSQKDMLLAQQKALVDLMDMLEYKFEEAEIDQTDFFRLYRKYIKEQFLTERKLNDVEVKKNDVSEKKTKRPIRH